MFFGVLGLLLWGRLLLKEVPQTASAVDPADRGSVHLEPDPAVSPSDAGASARTQLRDEKALATEDVAQTLPAAAEAPKVGP